MICQPLAFHPASDIFPLMEGEDLEELAQDIREHGLREPITLHPNGTILDGRNRYRACLRAGVEPRSVTWEDDGSPVSFVISLNLKRRQLTPSQRAMIALKAKPLLEAEARERQKTAKPGLRGGDRLPPMGGKGEANEIAGQAVGVSGQTVRRAGVVVKRGIPELAEKVKAGEMTVRRASLIASLAPDEQKVLLSEREEQIAATTRQLSRAGTLKSKARRKGGVAKNHFVPTFQSPKGPRLVALNVPDDPGLCATLLLSTFGSVFVAALAVELTNQSRKVVAL